MDALGEMTEVRIPVGSTVLPGSLTMPAETDGIVLFAHGSGSSRFSRRNRMVARHVERAGMATLLFDLLDPAECERDAATAELRFDISLLSERLVGALDWVAQRERLRRYPVGLFGASTGAAAALAAAVERPANVAAVVSRGGRPDLAATVLPRVTAPTLFIVGGQDHDVLRLNRDAAALMSAPHELVVVPGATHLFEEAGKLEQVASIAADWFRRYLTE